MGHSVPNTHLLEDSPRPPSYSFMAFSYSLLASSALRSHSYFTQRRGGERMNEILP